MNPRHAEIAGAGIAGLTAATALTRRGWSVRVHERAATLRATGSGIYIWENGLLVLDAIGALEAVTERAFRGGLRETRDQHNRLTALHRFDPVRHGRIITVHRQRLIEALADAARRAGAEIRTGSEAVAADPDGTLRLADGSVHRAELVLAADGVNSRVRDSLGIPVKRVKTGDGAIRFIVPRTEQERTDPAWQRYIEFWSGSRRVLYTPCDDETVYLALTSVNGDEAARALPFPTTVWTRSFPHLAELFARIEGPGRWDDFETITLGAWSRGRVAVLGDAAFAQAPNLGQGGGCAMMAALALAHHLDQAAPIEPALAAWERGERPLVEHTQRFTRFLSRVTFWPDSLRSLFFRTVGSSGWFAARRWRTAMHRPMGTSP